MRESRVAPDEDRRSRVRSLWTHRTLSFRRRWGDTNPAVLAPCRGLRAVFRRALQVSAVVGTTLFIINQLDVVLSGHVTPLVVLKVVLTYLVPFLVSMYSALDINRLRTIPAIPGKDPAAPPGAAA